MQSAFAAGAAYRPTFSTEERTALGDVWSVLDESYGVVRAAALAALARYPQFDAQAGADDGRPRELLRRALAADVWEPYLDELRERGERHADAGLLFVAWFEAVAAVRKVVIPLLFARFAAEVDRQGAAVLGLDGWLDCALVAISEGYRRAKQDVIQRQEQGIRELSTPVLELRERLLLAPLIGVLDSDRAAQLTEQLLATIRRARARAVVVDLTGVAAVDSAVANHLLQTVEAARLLGARVIVSGISAEIAQTLVRIGVDLEALNTVVDLRGGIEAAERLLEHTGEPGHVGVRVPV